MNSDDDTPKSCPLRVGCPIRRSRDQRSLASPPGFSQRAASFIASQCQGIHQMPLFRARSQGTPRPADDSKDHPHGQPIPRKTAAHRGKPHPSRPRHHPACGRSHEDTSLGRRLAPVRTPQDNSPTGQQASAAARPPRSHSQIRFTLQSTPAPELRPPARDMPARPPRNRNQTCSSPSDLVICANPIAGAGASGGERDRTDDLLLAKQALSQLSYTPVQKTRGQDDRGQNQSVVRSLSSVV